MTTLAWIVATAALLVGACIGVVVGGLNRMTKREPVPDIDWGPPVKYVLSKTLCEMVDKVSDDTKNIPKSIAVFAKDEKDAFEKLCKNFPGDQSNAKS